MAYKTKPIFAGQEEPIVVPQPSPSPATRFATMQRIMPAETQAQIYDSVFGPEPTPAETRDARFQDWLNSRKQAIEQQRTDDVRMARINALGNILTTMVQPLGWAIGGKGTGVTGGVQPVDNRQYLQAFERAVKANDDLRNIGTLEGEYQFKLAEDEARRAQELDNYQARKDIEYGYKSEYAKQRQLEELEKITLRGEYKLSEAEIRGKYRITKNGKDISGDELKTAKTQYAKYLEKYRTDVGRSVQRTEPNGMPLSFSAWLGSDYGGNYNVVPKDSPATSSPASPAPAAKPQKKGGFQTNGNSASGKKGGFKI